MTSPSIALARSRPSDAHLIKAARLGRLPAYAELSARHLQAARRLSALLTLSPAEADELVDEALATVLATLQRGGGPDVAFRPYLLTALRSAHDDRILTRTRLAERTLAAPAFARLPERWQLILWHTEVESETPAQVGRLLGLAPSAVTALTGRARERLRQAYLQEHVDSTNDPACHWAAQRFGAHVPEDDKHVDDCHRCTALCGQLGKLDTGLRGMLGPLVLGSHAAAYVAAGTGPTAGRGRLVRPRRWAQDNFGTANASAGLAAAAAVVAVVLLTGVTVISSDPTVRPEEPPSAAGAPAPGATALPGSDSIAALIGPGAVRATTGVLARAAAGTRPRATAAVAPARVTPAALLPGPRVPVLPVPRRADLGVRVTNAATQHGRAAVKVHVSNVGPGPTAEITLVITAPESPEPGSGLRGWACTRQQTLTCKHAPLASGASTTATVTVQVKGRVRSPGITDPESQNNVDSASLNKQSAGGGDTAAGRRADHSRDAARREK